VGKALDLPFDPIERAGEIWEATWGPASAMLVATSVMRVQQILIGRYDEILRPHGLTFARYEALVLLRFSRRGELPMKVIGSRLMVHPTSVTNTIDRLVNAGLVVRRPNPEDGRGVLAAITAAGRRLVERATADLQEADFGLAVLGEADRGQLFAALRRVRAAAGDFRAAPAGPGAGGQPGQPSGTAPPDPSGWAGADRSGADRSGVGRSGAAESGADRSGADRSAADPSGVGRSGATGSAADRSGSGPSGGSVASRNDGTERR